MLYLLSPCLCFFIVLNLNLFVNRGDSFLSKRIVMQSEPQEFVTDRSKAAVLMWFSDDCFGVRVPVMFHLIFVHYILVRFWSLSGHLLGNNCPLGRLFVLIVFCLFVIYLSLILVLRAGFDF